MMRILITCLITATTAMAQAQSKASPKPTPTPAATQTNPASGAPTLHTRDELPPPIPPEQTIITVHGLCASETGAANKAAVPTTQDCVIKVTKGQFDNLLNAFNPSNQPVPQASRRKLAEAYVDLLIFAEAAKAAGVENTPAYQEVMRVLRLKTMGDLYRNQLAEQFRNPSPEEIEAYYKENESKFEGAKLSRIFLPKNDPNPKATEEQKQQYQKKVLQVADDFQARAAKGEEMAKLQKEAYTSLGISAPPPNTDLSLARRGAFPAKLEQDIFSHKAGEVFRSEDGSGYLIYRVENRQPIPLDSVKDEITRQLGRTKMEQKTKELTAPVHADLDEAYFGPPAPGVPAGQPPVPNRPR